MARNNFIDILKGSLITLVCIGHASQFIIHQNNNFWHDPLFKTIYMFHMPLFMAVAGYLSFNGITAAGSPLKYIKKRSIAFLIPIFVWALFEQSLRVALTGQLTNINPVTIFLTGTGNLWFLWAILGSLVLTKLAASTGKYCPISLIILFGLTLNLPEKSHIFLFNYTFPFFITGFYCANFKISNIPRKHFKLLLFILIPISILCFSLWDNNTFIYISGMSLTIHNLPNILLRWFAGFVVSFVFLIILLYLAGKTPERLNSLLVSAGKYSINIYILQACIFKISTLAGKHIHYPTINTLPGVLFSIIAGCIITYFCLSTGRIISKNKYLNLLLFGKSQPSNSRALNKLSTS